MFTRRRSKAFLLDTVNRGAEFVEILKIVYPKASDLHEKDFDWLFDCPRMEQFLDWFCNTVGEENVLSPTEVEAYEELLSSEKPVLEDEALEQALKICRQSHHLNSVLQDNEALPLETMEREKQMLKSQCAGRIKRRNKLQICVASLKQELCHLAEKTEKASSMLKKAHLQLDLENIQSNNILSQACKITKELVKWHKEPRHERLDVLLARAGLGCYLELEEKVTKALLGFFPKTLPDAVNHTEAERAILAKKGWGGSQEQLSTEMIVRLPWKELPENRGIFCGNRSEDQKITTRALKSHGVHQGQLGSTDEPELIPKVKEMGHPKMEECTAEALAVEDGCQARLKTQAEMVHMENPKDNNLGSYQEELGRMEFAYVCSQKSLIMTSAGIRGILSALQWTGKALKAAKENKMEEAVDELRLHVVTCQEQLCILQSEVDQAKTQQLVLLLQCNAHLLRWPVICGELDLEAIRLGHVESMQEEAAAQLLGQLSHLDLLNLLLMLEEKNLHQMGTSLKEMVTILNGSQAKLQEWQSCCEDSRFSIKQCPRTLTDPSDLIILRLWEMLDKHGQEKQLFRTYETLAGRGSRLRQELRMLQVQLATPFSQLPKLESDNERLHCIMYGDSNQLMLHAQELSEPLEQLGMMQAKLYQMLMDTLSELKAKRKSLQSHFQKAERSLYMHFFNNPAQLKELVQELEKQALAFS
ncbi:uncharacterized protein LOC128345806 [Hemicordylus capensis]|uniref:uncharacterized protein LOC128345806 n=1 Tax=Hemicordylus capensis TaxID=884348 RepID=UPI0023032A47|nr:uncharacterized protein LOC128345806 [Hemicordylus capensis]XP_053154306.1 uncharacterized protein LOC128345806 [Hemicordylus capensis]XP_053154307.1 uncharacterized protein LOC128345806 [Hemicordylus capensis]XP_053154308.1 uncharacterized protein LOC128345806 [Hemicordylus capensis]